jgi:hypothetical protein
MIRWHVNILCVQKTKWKGQKVKENGVVIVINKSLKDGLVDIKRQRDRIILVKLLVGDLVFNVLTPLKYVSMRALRASSVRSWTCWLVVCPSRRSSIWEDLNRHVGSTRVGFDGVHGDFRCGSRNQEREDILNFVWAYDLIVVNTLFRKSLVY